jgi:hypothetical protein
MSGWWVLAQSQEQAELVVALVESGVPEVWMDGSLLLHHRTEDGARKLLEHARKPKWLLEGAGLAAIQQMEVFEVERTESL